MFRFSNDARRRRLGHRHLLADPGRGPLDVAEALVALHSSDPSTVYLTMQARVPGFSVGDLEEALYEERSLVRVYGMRRTLWVVDRNTLPIVDRSSTNQIAESNRRSLEKMVVDGDIATDGVRWTADVMDRTLAAIQRGGEVLAKELTQQIPELANKLTFYNKKGKLVGSSGVSTRILVQLALESKITRAQPVGSWISSQYRWAAMDAWLGGPIPHIDPETAAAELIQKWLKVFGPATTTDIRWWTGWTAARVKQALSAVGATEVQLDDGTGWVLEDDFEESQDTRWVALLPSLDPTTMGWKERDWYLGDHYPTLFDRNGNAGPTVWVDGRVVGGWAQRKSGNIVYELLEDVGRDATDAIAARAAELEAWMGATVVTPRFRSPHDKKLTK